MGMFNPKAVAAVGTVRGIVGNRNRFPLYQQAEATNTCRNQRIARKVSSNADWTEIRVCYPGFQFAGTELANNSPFTFRASLEYNGTIYPITFSGVRDYTFAAGSGQYVWSDVIPGLVLPAGAMVYERIRRVLSSLSGNNSLTTTEVDVAYGEWTYSGSVNTVDYTSGGEPGSGVNAYLQLNGDGSIASVIINGGGTGYSGSSINMYVYDPDAQAHTTTVIGTRTVTAGVISTGFIGSGSLSNTTGPYGPSARVVFATSGATLSGPAWHACLVTGVPSRAVESEVVVGDSIGAGYGAGDALGDEARNFSLFERAMGGRYGVVCFAYPGNAVATFTGANTYPTIHSLIDSLVTRAFLQIGTNDLAAGLSAGGLADALSTLARQWRALGVKVYFGTMPPRTTSSDSWATAANQTPVTYFTVGGYIDQANAMILHRQGAVAGDYRPADVASVVVDPANPNKWIPLYTLDGVHPSKDSMRVAAAALAKIWPTN